MNWKLYERYKHLLVPIALVAVSVFALVYAEQSRSESTCDVQNDAHITPCAIGNVSKFTCQSKPLSCCYNPNMTHTCFRAERAIDDWWMIALAFALYVYICLKLYHIKSQLATNRVSETNSKTLMAHIGELVKKNPESLLAAVTCALSLWTLVLCNEYVGYATIGISIWVIIFLQIPAVRGILDSFTLLAVCALLLGHAYNYKSLGDDTFLLWCAIVLFLLATGLLWAALKQVDSPEYSAVAQTDNQEESGEKNTKEFFWFVSIVLLFATIYYLNTVAFEATCGVFFGVLFIYIVWANREEISVKMQINNPNSDGDAGLYNGTAQTRGELRF